MTKANNPLTNANVKKLTLKAGILSVTASAIDEIKSLGLKVLVKLVKDANIYRESSGKTVEKTRSRLSGNDVKNASLNAFSLKSYAPDYIKCREPEKTTVRRAKPGKAALKKVKYYKNNQGCYVFGIEPFRKAISTIMKEDSFDSKKRDLTVSKEAVLYVINIVEKYLVTHLKISNIIATYCGRSRVTEKDIKIVRRIQMSFKTV